MENAFEAARAIPAWEAGLKAGMILKKHGARYWSSCPMHRDKTPSLMLDEKGRWHCFSCGAGGDAAALYGALYGLKPIEAAKRLCADFGLAAPQGSGGHGPPAGKRAATAMELKRAAEAFREREAARLLRIKFAARDEAASIARDAASLEAAWESPDFVRALGAMAAANTALYNLDAATPEQLVRAMP